MVSGISAGAVGVLSNWDFVKKNLVKANRKITLRQGSAQSVLVWYAVYGIV